jgi:O-antigen/teichoic acid export membrane protein
MIFYSYFQFVQLFSLAKFRVEYKYKIVSILTIISSAVGIVLSIYLIRNIFIDKSYYGKVIGAFIPISILAVIFMFYFLLKGKEFINFKYWKFALVISIPFILHNISGIVNAQFDRIIINQYFGNSETGIYSFAYNVGMIVNVLFMSFYQAYLPYYMEKMENKEYEKIKKISVNYRNLFVFLYAVILFISPEIVKLMAEESYWEGLDIIPYIFLGYFFNFMFTFETNTEYYLKKTKYISFGTMIAAIVNVSLNFLLVPKYGYFAAAVTTSISFFVQFIFHFIITKFVMKKPMYGLKFHLVTLIFGIIITLSFIFLKNYIILRYTIIIINIIIILYELKKGVLKNNV